jgi:hypothetical protein
MPANGRRDLIRRLKVKQSNLSLFYPKVHPIYCHNLHTASTTFQGAYFFLFFTVMRSLQCNQCHLSQRQYNIQYSTHFVNRLWLCQQSNCFISHNPLLTHHLQSEITTCIVWSLMLLRATWRGMEQWRQSSTHSIWGWAVSFMLHLTDPRGERLLHWRGTTPRGCERRSGCFEKEKILLPPPVIDTIFFRRFVWNKDDSVHIGWYRHAGCGC